MVGRVKIKKKQLLFWKRSASFSQKKRFFAHQKRFFSKKKEASIVLLFPFASFLLLFSQNKTN
jgi:polyphosphate kinase